MRSLTGLTFAVTIALAACSKGQTSDHPTIARVPAPPPTAVAPPTQVAAPETPAVAPPAAEAPKVDGDVVEIKLESIGETMTYTVTSLTVPTGKKVHLVLKNNSHSHLVPHNWVLTKPGASAKVALAMIDKKASGYIEPGDDVIAFTGLAGPQQTTEVTFTAPEPGTYPFVCTVPGHYVMMKGTLTVTP